MTADLAADWLENPGNDLNKDSRLRWTEIYKGGSLYPKHVYMRMDHHQLLVPLTGSTTPDIYNCLVSTLAAHFPEHRQRASRTCSVADRILEMGLVASGRGIKKNRPVHVMSYGKGRLKK